MKTNNIFKAVAFVTAAAFTVNLTASYAGESGIKAEPAKVAGYVSQTNIKAPAEAVIVEEPLSAVERLSNACENNDTDKIAQLCDSMIVELDASKAEIEAVAADISSWADDEIIARQQSYKSQMNVKYSETVKALTELRAGINTEANLAVISADMAEDEEYHRSDATPNIAVQPVEQTVAASESAKNAEIVSPAATADDLVYDKGVSDPIAIKALADTLGSAKDIYLFVKNGIAYEAYAGSKKDASITLEQLGGNDIDQAGLLVSLLRAKGIPARFMSGTVRITPEQAVEITGAKDASSAGRILSSRYRNTAKLTHNGELVGYRMYHTWVEAYVPYTDYRGAGNASGESVWVQLDPSFKKVEIKTESVETSYSEKDKELLKIVDDAKKDYPKMFDDIETNAEKVDLYSRIIVESKDEYIPSSLPYTVLEADQRYSFIKDEDKAAVSITVAGEKLFSEYVSDIYKKPLVVSYEPAGSSDKAVMDRYENLTDVPAYLVDVVPVVTCGDSKYVGKKSVSLGSAQKMLTSIKDGTGTTILDDSVYAGSMYAINLDLQNIDSVDAEKAEERIKKVQQDAASQNSYSPEIMGAFLDYSGKYYFGLCDSQEAIYTSIMNIERSRQLGLAITSYEFGSHYSLGIVDSLEYGSFHIDVAYNNMNVISRDGNKDTEKKFNMTVGNVESYCEGSVWEKLVDSNKSGISTVAVLNAAHAKGIDSLYMTRSNVEEELAKCNISASVKQEIRNFINKGMSVEALPETLTIGDWTGTAYIAYDMKTGSASYMISGGTAGGASHTFEQLLNINLMLSVVNAGMALVGMAVGTARVYKGEFTNDNATLSLGVVNVISSAEALASAYEMSFDSLDYIFKYVEEGDAMMEDFEAFTYQNIADTVAAFGAMCSTVGGAGMGIVGEMLDIVLEAYDTATTLYDVFDDAPNSIEELRDKVFDLIGLLKF